ncbi:hypothetical protein AB6A40_005427 [Gnathostoma spinigerum]|uniref:EF-hand domain-containing protein n=1 Tax=Gnathostoma spinigerum TaxID=75299 RepID=A0ABD6ENZ9_9BILA
MLACTAGKYCARPNTSEVNTAKGPTCGTNVAYAYFTSFVFFSSFLMLNLFVAVIMDNFDYLTRDSSILGPHHLDEFIRVWADYDPAATGRIHYTDMYEMLRNIAPPVGFGRKCPYRLAYKHLIRMNMPVAQDGTVHFTTTLFALIRESLSIKMRPVEEMDEADEELRQTLRKIWPLKAKKNMIDLVVPPNSELCYQKLTVGKIYAGLLILENYRAKKSGIEVGGVGLFGGGLRSLVEAAKSAADSGHLLTDEPVNATQPPRNASPSTRPYSLFSTLVDTIKAAKSSDSIDKDNRSPPEQYEKAVQSTPSRWTTGAGRRLSDMISRIRNRDNSTGEQSTQRFRAMAGNRAYGNLYDHDVERDYNERDQLLPLNRSRSPSPPYRPIVVRPPTSPTPSECYEEYRRRKTPYASYRTETDERPTAPCSPHYQPRTRRSAPYRRAVTAYSEVDEATPSLADGYLPNHDRRNVVPRSPVNNRMFPATGTLFPRSMSEKDDEDEEPMSSTAVRQRRLPIISTLPNYQVRVSRGSECYESPPDSPGPTYPDYDPDRGPTTARYAIRPDISSPSPISVAESQSYVSRACEHSRPHPGYRRSATYYAERPTGASTVVYATRGTPSSLMSASRPHTKVIQAQPGNVPLSDSDGENEKWAIV